MANKDVRVLRDLAKQYMEIACFDIHNKRRKLWSDFNSMRVRHVPVLILTMMDIWREVFSEKDLLCDNELYRYYENWLRMEIYHASLGDDYIIEPWVPVKPVYKKGDLDLWQWGFQYEVERIQETMAFHLPAPSIISEEDLIRLTAPDGIIDEKKTLNKLDILGEAIGDIVPVVPNYFPAVLNLPFILAYLLGPEDMMYLFYEQPETVHAVSKFISDARLKLYEDVESGGRLFSRDVADINCPLIQSIAYCHELPAPDVAKPVTLKQHWVYDAAQEFESVSPKMFNEFVLEYQKPTLEKFGLTSYGCCENLTGKIKYLKQIKNLRRVAVTPWADNEECAKQLEDKYIISWRPHPVEMVTNDFVPERISSIVKKAKSVFDSYGCYWEVNLKDFLSVGHDRDRLRSWVNVVRASLED